jgi:uncharacterized protein YcbK (DUF882 family)
LNNIKVSKNFKLYEFQCKDGSNLVKVDSELVNKLQQLRETINKPIIINSAYRTIQHNKNVGGSPTSQHLLGKAADIRVNGMSPKELAKYCEQIGFGGIGIYNTFVHVDTRTKKARW